MTYTIPNTLQLDLTREFLAEQAFAPLYISDDVTWRFKVLDEESVAVDLTGATVTMTIYNVDNTITFELEADLDTQEVIDAISGLGWFGLSFVPATHATDLLPLLGRQWYTIRILDGGLTRTFAAGRVDILYR